MILRHFATKMPLSRRLYSSTSISRDMGSAIAELNKEMEHLFGESPFTGPTNPNSENHSFQEDSSFSSEEETKSENRLTHVGTKGEAQMVDVSPQKKSLKGQQPQVAK